MFLSHQDIEHLIDKCRHMILQEQPEIILKSVHEVLRAKIDSALSGTNWPKP